jgi:hypothetical protein
MAKTDVRPTQVQMLLMEHLLQFAVWELNEIRLVLGLTVDTSHDDLMNILRGMLRGGTPDSSGPHD